MIMHFYHQNTWIFDSIFVASWPCRLWSKLLTRLSGMKHISHTMHLKLICILFLVGFSQSLTRKEYRFKASLKHRSGVQRPISKHENGLPLECQVNCRIGEAFTFMVPLDTECPKNMEDIDEVKISAKDYCSKIPESGKVVLFHWITYECFQYLSTIFRQQCVVIVGYPRTQSNIPCKPHMKERKHSFILTKNVLLKTLLFMENV